MKVLALFLSMLFYGCIDENHSHTPEEEKIDEKVEEQETPAPESEATESDEAEAIEKRWYEYPLAEMREAYKRERLERAASDWEKVPKCYPASGTFELEEFYQKRANLFPQLFGFENFQMKSLTPGEYGKGPHRILLLTSTLPYLVKMLNRLAWVANCLDQGKLTNCRYWHEIEIAHRPNIYSVMEIDSLDQANGLVREIAVSEKIRMLWPEARELEFTFGDVKLQFLFSHKMEFLPGSQFILRGSQKLQTPAMLHSLEGVPLRGIWMSIEEKQIRYTLGPQFKGVYLNRSFERLWDHRSPIFSKDHSFMVHTDSIRKHRTGQTAFPHHKERYFVDFDNSTYNDMNAIKDIIQEITQESGFKFINKN